MSQFDPGSNALRLSPVRLLQVVIFLLGGSLEGHFRLSKGAPMPHAQVTTLAGADRIQLHAVPGKSTTPALVDDPADRRIPYGFAIGDPDADLSNTALDVAVNLDRVYADENGLAGSWLRPNTPETTLRLHGSGGNAFLTVYAGDLHLGTLLTDELLWFMRAAIARIYGNPPDCVTTSPKRHRNSHAAGTHVSYQRTARPRGRRA